MKLPLRIVLCLAVMSISLLLPSALSAQTAYNVTVKQGGLRQSFDGFGASHWDQTWSAIPSGPRNTMADMVFGDLKAKTLRCWVSVADTITVSDMLTEFNTLYIASGAIADVKSRGVNTVLLAPWNYYNNPNSPPANLSTYASNLAELILQIKNTYGVTVDVTGIFNEPEPVWSTTDIVNCIKYLRIALDSRGLSNVQIVAPESSSHGTASDTVPVIAVDATAWNAIAEIGSHSYSMLSDDKLDQLKNGKPWWVTEAGDGTQSELSTEDDSRGSALAGRFLSEVNHGANRWVVQIGLGQHYDALAWNLDTAFLTMYDTHTSTIITFLKYYYLKQAMSNFDVACIFRKCVSGTNTEIYKQAIANPPVSAAAAYNPDGSWAVSVVNQTGIATPTYDSGNNTYPAATDYNVTITVEELAGSGSKSFNVYRTKAGSHFVSSGTVNLVNGVGTVLVAQREMVSLRSAATAAAIPPVPNGLVASTYNAPVVLNWNNTVKSTSWKVKRATTSGGPYTTIATPVTTCYKDMTAVNGTVYYYVVSAVNATGESANSAQVVCSPTPNPWSTVDIGLISGEIAGSYKISDTGVISTKVGGIYFGSYDGTPDKFNFTYRSMTGDGTVIVHMGPGENPVSLFGIMMREDLTTTSKGVGVYYDFGGWDRNFMWIRTSVGAGGLHYDIGQPTPKPMWYKLVRAGNLFTGSCSSNGTTWATISSQTVTMANTVYIGLSGASASTSIYGYAPFDSISLPPATPTGLKETASPGQVKLGWTASMGATSYKVKRATSSSGSYTTLATVSSPTLSYTDNTVSSGTNYYYAVSAVNSCGESANSTQWKAWLNTDIGSVGLAGSCVNDGINLSATAAGVYFGNYDGTPDQFNFTYRSMTGDGTLIAHLASGTSGTGLYGLMMREDMTTTSKIAAMYRDFGGWSRSFFVTRATVAAGGLHYDVGVTDTPPIWFRLVRTGNVFTGSLSFNGTSWTTVSSQTVTMASTIYVGFSNTSNGTTVYGTGSFDNVSAP